MLHRVQHAFSLLTLIQTGYSLQPFFILVFMMLTVVTMQCIFHFRYYHQTAESHTAPTDLSGNPSYYPSCNKKISIIINFFSRCVLIIFLALVFCSVFSLLNFLMINYWSKFTSSYQLLSAPTQSFAR